MALALAIHNVAEGAVLCAVLAGQGASSTRAAAIAVASNLATVPAAAGTLLAVAAWPVLTPWLLGLAVGTLVYLVMVDLLPEAYLQAGHASIALVVSLTLGAIVLLEGSSR
jgi:ZIP family zinc transporter